MGVRWWTKVPPIVGVPKIGGRLSERTDDADALVRRSDGGRDREDAWANGLRSWSCGRSARFGTVPVDVGVDGRADCADSEERPAHCRDDLILRIVRDVRTQRAARTLVARHITSCDFLRAARFLGAVRGERNGGIRGREVFDLLCVRRGLAARDGHADRSTKA